MGVNKTDFKVFDKKKMEDYSKRAKEQWGQIAQYQEFEEKTKGVSDTQQKDVINRFMLIFTEFGKIKELDTSCDTVQLQVKKLQDFITENYYTCTKEICHSKYQVIPRLQPAGEFYVQKIWSKQLIFCRSKFHP